MSQMNPFNSYRDPQAAGQYVDQTQTQAIARFFNAVYAWMAAGLALTAVVAYYVAGHIEILQSLGRGGIIAMFLVELGLVFAISAAVRKISAPVATLLFLIYAAMNGVVLSVLLLVYTHQVLGSAFAITAGMFGATSLYGFVTKKDLSAMGSLLFMALIGLIIATVVNIFIHSGPLQMLINYVGVLIFVGLTAYDTQKLKTWAVMTAGDAALAVRLSISGALALYLDFLNLFIYLVQILGDRK